MGTLVALASRATLAGRVALARALISHRPWCPDCRRYAALIDQALSGATIEDLTREDTARGTG